jgi:hypothetical protein
MDTDWTVVGCGLTFSEITFGAVATGRFSHIAS